MDKPINQEQNQSFKRQIAQIISIKELLLGNYIKEEGWEPNYILSPDNKKISRVNIIATVVSKSDDELTIDDSESSIGVKSFELNFLNINVGDTVNIIGRPREFNNNKYLASELIQIVDKRWLMVRKKELKAITPEIFVNKIKEETIVEEDTIKDNFESLIDIIRKLDKGQGVSTEELISKGIEESVINKMLENGDIFEITPGKLKILE